jgi:predicted AlkP superfamily phosphohydrolase/phosphomutase
MVQMFGRRRKNRRVLVLGLDCAGPQLVFEQLRSDLPVLSQLMEQGTWGELESSIPCITVPAWASMLSSRDPGVLGCYGFRNRVDYGYGEMQTANSTTIKAKRVWDYVAEAGRDSVVIGVPQTYPIQPMRGHMVSDLLTPGQESAFAFPAIFKQEVLNLVPNYAFDVKDFRTTDKARLLSQIIDMTESQFKLVQHCLKTKSWDFFMYVNIGVDRIHHGFWRYHDPEHRLHEPTSPYVHAIRDYYKLIDRYIGEILEIIGDEVMVLVVSDHGVRRMDGGICLNEWLWRNGWLWLKTAPEEGKLTPVEKVEVDWARTKAWASGGYYGRVFLNVAGREAQGVILHNQYQSVRDELAQLIAAIADPEGTPLNTTVFKPENIYTQVRGIAPDLLVYFGDLHWRAVGSLGHGRHYTLENDTGPDDANHAPQGMFILYEPGRTGDGQVSNHQLMDIAPTILDRMGLPVPHEMQGRIIG